MKASWRHMQMKSWTSDALDRAATINSSAVVPFQHHFILSFPRSLNRPSFAANMLVKSLLRDYSWMHQHESDGARGSCIACWCFSREQNSRTHQPKHVKETFPSRRNRKAEDLLLYTFTIKTSG